MVSKSFDPGTALYVVCFLVVLRNLNKVFDCVQSASSETVPSRQHIPSDIQLYFMLQHCF